MAVAGMGPAMVTFSRRYHWAGYTIGFALGGFFDGILLHQILQWHHLLAGIEHAAFQDIRIQILADGLFHALMYILAAAGLWLLWRTRGEFGLPRADKLLLANALIGFGIWHVLDGVVSHWVTGIHRIRMDSDVPLLWDLLWFFVFGIIIIIVGWLLRHGGGGRISRNGGVPAALAALTVFAAGIAALPPPGVSTVVVVFMPGTTPAQASAAMASVEGRLVWSDPSDQVWGIDLPAGASARELYRHGALLVSNSLLPVGCLNWFEI